MREQTAAVDPITTLPAIINLADTFELAPSDFLLTMRKIAMPSAHSDHELVACCLVAKELGLNPLTKEIYFMKGKGGSIQPIVSVDGWARKCNEHPAFDGMDFKYDIDDDGKPISVTCIIYRNDRKHPVKATEFLDECQTGAGPVWKTHPKRMLRHRALTQAARYAFGFAGVMDRDEFDQWQRMKDVTPPTPLTVANDLPDIPDLPDAVDELPPDDDVIADPAGFVEHYRDQYAEANEDERKEIAEANADIVARLPEQYRREIAAIVTEAA